MQRRSFNDATENGICLRFYRIALVDLWKSRLSERARKYNLPFADALDLCTATAEFLL